MFQPYSITYVFLITYIAIPLHLLRIFFLTGGNSIKSGLKQITMALPFTVLGQGFLKKVAVAMTLKRTTTTTKSGIKALPEKSSKPWKMFSVALNTSIPKANVATVTPCLSSHPEETE
jgi:hypothetical protein